MTNSSLRTELGGAGLGCVFQNIPCEMTFLILHLLTKVAMCTVRSVRTEAMGIGMNSAFPKHFSELGDRGQLPVHGINYRKQWCNDIVW